MNTIIVCAIGVLVSTSAHSALEDDLREASLFVDEATQTRTLSSTAAPVALPRFYQKGDRWIVSVAHVSHGFVRKMADKLSAMVVESAAPQLYEFRVVEIKDASARIAVTQVDENEKPVVSPRLAQIEIEINKSLQIVRKSYQRRGSQQLVVLQAESKENAPSGFFPVPIELPDLADAKLLERTESGKLARYSSTDLFGRPVLIEWREGDLWPTRVQTISGTSLLTKQEKI